MATRENALRNDGVKPTAGLALPLICAPMFFISGVDLMIACRTAGIVAGLPRHNFRDFESFKAAIREINDATERFRDAHPRRPIGPLAINISTALDEVEMRENLAFCHEQGVSIFISATGNPTELIQRVHDQGGKILCDATAIRFAEKAIEAGADGINAIGSGGGGHSGTLSHLALVSRIRAMFDGIVTMAGGLTDGASIRAAQALGADMAYMGTRFIATREAAADDAYKQMIVDGGSRDLIFTNGLGGAPANWLRASLAQHGLDPDNLPPPPDGKFNHKSDYSHLPEGARPWATIWSAGQGIDLIHDIPSVHDLVARLTREYFDIAPEASAARVESLLQG